MIDDTTPISYREDDSIEYEDTLRDEYDLSELGPSVRGKYAEAYKRASNVVVIDDDVSQVFPNAKAVNDALRMLMQVAQQHVAMSK